MSIKYRLTQSKRRSNQAKWKHLSGWSIRERGGFKITCIFCHIKHFVNVGALFVLWWIPDPTLNELWMIVWLSQIKSKFFILFWELQNKAIVACCTSIHSTFGFVYILSAFMSYCVHFENISFFILQSKLLMNK